MTHEIILRREVKNLGRNNSAALIKKAAANALECEGINVPCVISVLLTDDKNISEINRDFRNIDAPTDVLSFPLNELTAGKFDPAACERNPETGAVLLGDIVLSIPRCAAQGEEFGHGFDRELCYLTTHSVLHLLGYDHADEAEMKKQMRAREKAIMARIKM